MSSDTLLTFLLLGGAIGAVWFNTRMPVWTGLFIAAIIGALASGVLHAPALIALGAFSGAGWLAGHARAALLRNVALAATIVLALLLAMHKLPGFNSPILIDRAVLSAGAVRFTLYANFDKGAVGLILLALLCKRVSSWAELGTLLRPTLPLLLLTIVAVMGFALAAGVVGVDLKLPPQTLTFVLVNLLFTVIAEEAFFRGLLQARLAAALARFRWGAWLAVAVSALLFGAAHLGGGLRYGILAVIAGFGYAWAYHRTQRIEAAILVHIALNTAHFIAFTYPARIDVV